MAVVSTAAAFDGVPPGRAAASDAPATTTTTTTTSAKTSVKMQPPSVSSDSSDDESDLGLDGLSLEEQLLVLEASSSRLKAEIAKFEQEPS